MLQAWKDDFKAWLAGPLDAPITPFHMFLTAGLYTVAVIFWIFVLGHLIAAIKAAD